MSSSELIGQTTTAQTDPALALNHANLLQFLVRSNVPGYTAESVLEVKKFSTGQSNPTYLVDGKMVLRKQPPGSRSNNTAHRMDREFAVLKALQKTNVPAPEPIAYCEDAAVLGGTFYLMSFVRGRVFSSPALVGMDPNERRAAYRSVVETLAKIHSVDWRACGLSEFGQVCAGRRAVAGTDARGRRD
jgi:aminoglycoside phosphotransferase (APT) family kinase protein